MVAYSFKPFFAPQIVDRIKLQTIRADRRRHARPGEPLQLFIGMRTRYCRKIIADPICIAVSPIVIEIEYGLITHISVDGHELSEGEMEAFARQDGFAPEYYNEPSGMCGRSAIENMETFWIDNRGGRGTFQDVLIRWGE